MDLLTDRAAFAVEFIDLEAASRVAGAKWEPFQISFLNNSSRFGVDVKSRQIAWSFTAAVNAVTDGILEPGNPHIFVSINMEEAKEKIRYVRDVINALDPPVRQKYGVMVRDSLTEIELANGTRFISHPCRPPRGKPRARIYLDEWAWYPRGMDREIYKAALPATTKGDGYIRGGSSPSGADGLFWEIYTETLRQYPGYRRGFYPWWMIGSFCTDTHRAIDEAPGMDTETRVRTFGTQALIEIFENMFLEDFQQEYECAWLDELLAWIDWDLIKRNQEIFHAEDMTYWHARSVDEALLLIDEVNEAVRTGKIEQSFAAGLDVGRSKHFTEFIAVGKSPSGRRPVRLMVSLDGVEFDDQQRCFRELIERLPITNFLIDQNGIGMQLAENLEKSGRAEGVTFTNQTKELWAVEGRVQFQRGNVPLPPDRDLAYQIHSIKKKVTGAGNNVFDTDASEKHHADMWWALALALWGAKSSEAWSGAW